MTSNGSPTWLSSQSVRCVSALNCQRPEPEAPSQELYFGRRFRIGRSRELYATPLPSLWLS